MRTISVDGPRGSAPARRKRVDRAGDNFTDHLDSSAATGDTSPVAATAPLVGTDALLGLQDVNGEQGRAARQRARRHGEELLDRLESLRADILLGEVPAGRLAGLAHLLRAEHQRSGDPRIDEVLDAIELRVAVELAKLERDR